jgi:Helix-turn-helix domain
MRSKEPSFLPPLPESLPSLRFAVPEAARILRISRAQVYNRIQEGVLRPQKDGARTFLTHSELERYVRACEKSNNGLVAASRR